MAMRRTWLGLLAAALVNRADGMGVATRGSDIFRRALTTRQPVLVEITDADADDPLDVAELSEMCRDAGAAALVLPPSLLGAVAAEQASAKGNYPGPVPLICDPRVADGECAPLELLRDAGAAALAVVAAEAEADGELVVVVDQLTALGLGSLVFARDAGEHERAVAAGAAAVVCDYAGAAADGGDDGAVLVRPWDGDADELAALRSDGSGGALLLRDGCAGSIRDGRDRCAFLVREARSKRSSKWAGSMFGVSDGAPPSARNPRMWAQSKRQAREIMHDSAAKRGLPPPKLGRS